MVTGPISPATTSASSGIGGGLTFSAYGYGNASSAASGGARLAGNSGEERRGSNASNGIGLGRPGMKPSISLSDNHPRSQLNQHSYATSSAYASNSQAPHRNGQSSRPGMMQKSNSDYPGASSSFNQGNMQRPGSADRSFSATSNQSSGMHNASHAQQGHSRQRSRGGSEGPQMTNSSSMPLSHQHGLDDVARDTARLHWRALRTYLREYLQAGKICS